jgi:hypothetical protein
MSICESDFYAPWLRGEEGGGFLVPALLLIIRGNSGAVGVNVDSSICLGTLQPKKEESSASWGWD